MLLNNHRKNSEQGSLFLVLFCAVILTACSATEPAEQQTVFTGPIMGTEYRITVVHRGDAALEGLEARVVESMQQVNSAMSHYLPESELSIFNRSTVNQPRTLSTQFAQVMRESLLISELSGGAFDVTLARAINLWGFGPDGRISKQPTQAELERLKQHIGFDKLRLEGDVLAKTHDDVTIDLSAIAKGYAVDQVAESLLALDHARFLIDIGGELRASGKALDQRPWRVGIEKPHILGGLESVIELDGQAIATSGDYRNYHVIDGQHFSHTIDPVSLRPVLHKLALVSVMSDRTSTADALATAMMVMGEERAIEFATQQDLSVYLVIREPQVNRFRTIVMGKFKQSLQ